MDLLKPPPVNQPDIEEFMNSGKKIIIFDGICNLCNFFVRFVSAHDPEKRFFFASLQSDTVTKLIDNGIKLPNILNQDSVLLFDNGVIYNKSDAALRIFSYLKAPWSWLFSLRIFPRLLRNALYNLIAANRYKWFGKTNYCTLQNDHLLP